MASQLDPALIGNRADITALVVAASFKPEISDSPLLQGWRHDFCGQALLAVLSGEGASGLTQKPDYLSIGSRVPERIKVDSF